MTELTDLEEEGFFNLCVNQSDGCSRKKKLAGKRLMMSNLQKMGKRPLWRRQLGSMLAQQSRQRKKKR